MGMKRSDYTDDEIDIMDTVESLCYEKSVFERNFKSKVKAQEERLLKFYREHTNQKFDDDCDFELAQIEELLQQIKE
jgi:hypothetical protein